MKNKFFLWLLIFLTFFTLTQSWTNRPNDSALETGSIGIATKKESYSVGKEVVLKIQNNSSDPIELSYPCNAPAFKILQYAGGEWHEIQLDPIEVKEEDEPCENELVLDPGKKGEVSYKNWAYRIFSETGRYRIDVTTPIDGESKTIPSNEFTIVERGLISQLWMNLIYRPILNTLVFLIEKIPGHSLGVGIIILTLIIRTLLLIPSQRAMRSQKKMQKVQEEIEELKKKHGKNQEKLALETVALWKKHKVNPFGSCLVLLIQFPILIALYYVVWEGLNPDKVELLYSFLTNELSFEKIQTNFLGVLELTKINFFILPLIVGGLQFAQLQLTMSRKKKKSTPPKPEKIKKNVEGIKDMQNEMQMATNMMKYVLPIMIAFFSASLPAAVGLYWATSTLYGIAQQFVVNKESDTDAHSNEPTVRVIEK